MKKQITDLLVPGLALLSIMTMTSCSDDDTADASHLLEVKSVLPTKVMEGQVVTITGTGLDEVTSVVFPGNVAVSNMTKVAGGYITVTTPAGIATGGGNIIVEANGESAEAPMALTVGKPEPVRVAPLDQEIKINECVEVYGNDLEFITKAYFPGDDGYDLVVDASLFKRKSTGSLNIYSPMGIKAGPAQVVLEDCSGKKYTLPEVTLSDEVSGGNEETGGERYVPIWQDEGYIYGIQPTEFHPEGDAYIHSLKILDEVSKVNSKPLVRFAALVHDLGKGTTPAEMLPHHYFHETRGLEVFDEMKQRLKMPSDWVKFSKLVIAEHMRAPLFSKPGKKVDLLMKLNSKKINLKDFNDVIRADHKGLPPYLENSEYIINELLKVKGTSAPPELKGQAVGKWIRSERIRQFINLNI